MIELVYTTVYWQRSGEKEDRSQDVEMNRNRDAGDVRTGWCEATCPDLSSRPRAHAHYGGAATQSSSSRALEIKLGWRVGAGWRRAHGRHSLNSGPSLKCPAW